MRLFSKRSTPNDVLKGVDNLSASDLRLLSELAWKLASAHEEQPGSPPAGPPADLRPHVDPWLSYLLAEGKSPRTLETYGLYVRLFLREFPSPTERDITAYLAGRAARGTQSPTIATTICALKSLFKYLTQMGVVHEDPSRHFKAPPPPRRERSVPDALSLSAVLATGDSTQRDRALLLLLIDCGLRILEAVSLRPDDVDLRAHQVTVTGKGAKQRTVPFSKATAAALRQYTRTLSPGATWLFPGRPATNHLGTHGAGERLQALCHRAGVPRITPHPLRHFYATTMLNDGANLRVVSELLGHASPSVTANVYWHVLGAKERRREHQRHSPLRGVLRGAHP